MKKIIIIMFVLALCFTAIPVMADDINITLDECKSTYSTMECQVTLQNNNEDYDIDYCTVTIKLMNGNEILTSTTRPFTDIPAQTSKSMRYIFSGKNLEIADKCRYSVTDIEKHFNKLTTDSPRSSAPWYWQD
jgi:hypothetical protein